MPYRAIVGVPAGQGGIAVDDTDEQTLPRLVGWGQLTCPGGVPAWQMHDAYWTDVVDDNGPGDYNVHQVTHDPGVIVICQIGSSGEELRQDGPAVAASIRMRCRLWVGATVAVDGVTHQGTITSGPIDGDFGGSISLFAIKVI